MKLGYLPCYVGGDIFPFDALFDEAVEIKNPIDVLGCDAIVLWGGEDISSIYYGQKPHIRTQNQAGPSKRDIHEYKSMLNARKYGVPIIGVCRGAQFLCAFAGGSLIQHTTGHHHDHDVMCMPANGVGTLSQAKVYQSSSDHHQMMYVDHMAPCDYDIMAWSVRLSKVYEDGDGPMECKHERGFIVEPEAIYFPNVRGFAIQGHLEWMNRTDGYVKWCLDVIATRLLAPAIEPEQVEEVEDEKVA